MSIGLGEASEAYPPSLACGRVDLIAATAEGVELLAADIARNFCHAVSFSDSWGATDEITRMAHSIDGPSIGA